MKKLLFLFPAMALLAGCGTQPTPTVDTGSAEYILSGYVDTGPIVTTGSVSVNFEKQPTQLPGNYQDNGTFLRAWAEKNIKTLDIPAKAKDVRIGFKFVKTPKYANIPGNLQLSVDGKNLCNGRLSNKAATMDLDTFTAWYDLNNISTQDKPDGVDATSAIGKTLTIKARIGESRNYLESVILDYNL